MKEKLNNFLRHLASLKLTVICLFIFTVLVIWGTIYQADHGLYQAQEKFFSSWIFLIFGFIPFPGTVLIMYVLFINLVLSMFYRIGFRVRKLGVLITHLGIIILLLGGFFTFYFSQESSLMLKEGENSEMSSSRELWELAIWEQKGKERDVFAIDAQGFSQGETIGFEELNLQIKIKEFYKNCSAFTGKSSDDSPIINASGIQQLRSKPISTEVNENIAGGVFDIILNSSQSYSLILYGQDSNPTIINHDNFEIAFSLRKKRILLPLSLTLKDFQMKYYPNSKIPKSYSSKVTIKTKKGLDRDVVISMNKPLRFEDYTFFQSSYYIAPDGSEYTILAVVKNVGRLLPYFSSLTIFLGMLIHFLIMLVRRKKNGVIGKKNNPANQLIKVASLIIVLLGVMSSQSMLAQVRSLEKFKKIVVMENGRQKPLDTFAQNILKQFSGRSTFDGESAVQWLSKVLLMPAQTFDDRVFLINNPEVLDSIDVIRVGKARGRYSFSQFQQSLPKLRQLAIQASRIDDKNRSFIENELLTLYNKLYIYQELTASFGFLFPNDDFKISSPEIYEILGLSKAKRDFSFIDLLEKKVKFMDLMLKVKGKNQDQWSVAEKEAVQLYQRLQRWGKFYKDLPFTIIPAFDIKGEEKWLSPWEIVSPIFLQKSSDLEGVKESALIPRSLYLMRDFYDAYIEKDQPRFDKAVQSFNQLILEKSRGSIRPNAIYQEIIYNKLDPFYKAKFFYGFSILLLLLSFVYFRKWLYRFAFIVLIIGFILHLVGVLMRMYIRLRPPVTNLYETFIFTGLIAVLLGIVLEFFKKKNLGIATGGLAGLVMLMIAGKYALEGDTMGMLVAVLDSNFWLAAHVITIILGYAGIVLSGFIGHVYIVQRMIWPLNNNGGLESNKSDIKQKFLRGTGAVFSKRAPGSQRQNRKDTLKNTFQAMYAIQAFGIIFTFIGTVLGGIWADQSWGRFWGWDPKENGALLVLLWSAILFHARLAKMIKETGFAIGSVIGIIAVSLAWFGVNLLGVGLHSYGFTSGIAQALFLFIAFEVIFIGISMFFLNSSNKVKVRNVQN